MKRARAQEILEEFESIDRHLGWQEERGIMSENTKIALYLIQIARPFLKTLLDIAQSLESIANK